MELTLKNGEKLRCDGALVMGIVNVTPDSFFEGSRCQDEETLRQRIRQIIAEGGAMVDVGAYSSRPDGTDIPEEEEMARLAAALPVINEELAKSERCIPVSVDTFRAGVAKRCVEEYGVDIINDISGGTLDEEMLRTVVELNVPYILMHMRGTPQTMKEMTDYPDGVTNDVMGFFRQQIGKLEDLAEEMDVDKDSLQVILDPGFGFAKTIEQNYQLFSNLPAFKISFKDYPLLVGISRKSMIYKLLDTDAANSLNGTSILNALAVASGADILRVHDVKEAVEVVRQLCTTEVKS